MPIANTYPEKSASHIVPNADPRFSVLVVTIDNSYAPTGIVEEPAIGWHFLADAEGAQVRAAVPLHPSSGSGPSLLPALAQWRPGGVPWR